MTDEERSKLCQGSQSDAEPGAWVDADALQFCEAAFHSFYLTPERMKDYANVIAGFLRDTICKAHALDRANRQEWEMNSFRGDNAMSSYDEWKTRSDWDEEAKFYPGPSNKQIADKIEQLTRDIDWLTTRLANLSLSDEDFDQTQDYIFELRHERESLKRCFNV